MRAGPVNAGVLKPDHQIILRKICAQSEHLKTVSFYDSGGRIVHVSGCDPLPHTWVPGPPLPPSPEWGWEHLPDKRLYALTEPEGEGDRNTEYWRDYPIRYLVVEPEPETGKLRPSLKHGKPVYLWLCREEHEVR
jgi:hypothetical protein